MALDIDRFVTLAEQAGMPVKILQSVWRHYSTRTGSSSYVRPFFNRLYLEKEAYVDIKMASLASYGDEKTGRPVRKSEKSGVQSLYHEAMHAYVDLKTDLKFFDVFVRDALDGAERYYNGTKVTSGAGRRSSAEDTFAVANEAAAEYVGHRASVMWDTLDSLFRVLHGVQKVPEEWRAWVVDVERLQANYNKSMADRIWGYEKRGNNEHHVLTREMPPLLVQLCDRVLENKIPDQFLLAPTLRSLYEEFDVYVKAARSVQRPAPALDMNNSRP